MSCAFLKSLTVKENLSRTNRISGVIFQMFLGAKAGVEYRRGDHEINPEGDAL